MFLIIKHLESSIGIDDIENMAFGKSKNWFFQKNGEIKAIKIIGLENKSGNMIERHGLIRVTPDSYKKQLLKDLNGRSLNGVKIVAANYAIRHWSNDPRLDEKKSFFSFRKESVRRTDRRRPGLHIVTVVEKTYAHR